MVSTLSKRARHGFTLVEIMIVVLIIGMLLAIAVPNFQRARAASQAKGCQHNLKEMLGAKERWAMDNHKDATDTPDMSDIVPNYIKVTPQCPQKGSYDLRSMDDTPICSVGGTRGQPTAHVLP